MKIAFAIACVLVVVMLVSAMRRVLAMSQKESDSQAVSSEEDGSSREVIAQVLTELSSRTTQAFCTFELIHNPKVCVQVNGIELAQGLFSWIEPGDPLPKLKELGVPLLPGIKVLENEQFSGNHVVVINCESAGIDQWVDFIDALLIKAHGSPADYAIRGWVSCA